MNMFKLKAPPPDAADYVTPSGDVFSEQQIEQWIRSMVGVNRKNLHIPFCQLSTIQNVYEELKASRYRVQILPITGETMLAEFYLMRLSPAQDFRMEKT